MGTEKIKLTIKQICCGETWFNIILTYYGILYSWGYNKYQQLGRECTKTFDNNIERVTIVSDAKIGDYVVAYLNL